MSKSETLTLIYILERSNGLPGGVKAPKYPAEHLVTGLSREQWQKVICVGWLTFWFDQIGEIVGIGLMDFLSIVFYGACQPEFEFEFDSNKFLKIIKKLSNHDLIKNSEIWLVN